MSQSGVRLQWRSLQLAELYQYKDLVHGFSTRRGGVSQPPFFSLNLSLDVGDDSASVGENRRLFLSDLGIGNKPLVKTKQVHEDQILVIDRETACAVGFPEAVRFAPADALITAVGGIILAVSVADCVPLLLFDRKEGVVATVHGGWRSTAARLGSKVVRKMGEIFGTRPEDIVVGIGPAIGPCCYEVDEPVISAFSDLSPRWQEWVQEEGRGHWHLDLIRANQTLLLEVGVPQGQIFSSGICTSCQQELFFSHRRDGGKTGRMMGLIMREESHR